MAVKCCGSQLDLRWGECINNGERRAWRLQAAAAATVVAVAQYLFVEPVVERLPPAPSHGLTGPRRSSIGVRTQISRAPAVADIAPAGSAARHGALGRDRPQSLLGLHGNDNLTGPSRIVHLGFGAFAR